MPVVITRTDGGVSIMSLHDDFDGFGPQTQAAIVRQEIDKWVQSHPGEYVSHREIEASDIPADRTFRNAWADNGKEISHDMDKAREISRDKLADDAVASALAQQRQEFRDAAGHPDIDAAETPEALMQVVTNALK